MHQIGTQPANTSTHHTGHSKSLLAEAFFNLHLLCICTTDNLWTSEGSNGLMEGIFFTHPIFSPIHEPTSHTMQMQFDALHCMQENQNAFASRCTENFMHLNASASRCTEALMHQFASALGCTAAGSLRPQPDPPKLPKTITYTAFYVPRCSQKHGRALSCTFDRVMTPL